MKRLWMRKATAVLLFLCLLPASGWALWTFKLEPRTRIDPARFYLAPCRVFYDKNGRMLNFQPDKAFRRHIRAPGEEIPKQLEQAFIAAEDHRFFSHHGVDPEALLRAAWKSVLTGRIVSGASTITEQLVGLVYPHKRTLASKCIEIVRALRLENLLGKNRILALYLNRVPLGNNLYGVETASLFYFGIPCSRLSAAQSALLASIPKAPSILNPYGPNVKRLLARKDWVLFRMRKLGFITPDRFKIEKRRPIIFLARRFPREAPNFINMIQGSKTPRGGDEAVQTTLDLPLQRRVEEILRSHKIRLESRGASQAAAVVLANKGVCLRALAGSISYCGKDGGFNNGALSRRSPGSALKPFLYALALDRGLTSSTVLYDVKRSYPFAGNRYTPLNFDRVAYGPVLMRDALANSMNLSAVWLLQKIGIKPFYCVLQALRLISQPGKGADYYGLGMVIGNPEVTVLGLATAYAALANAGIYRTCRMWKGEPQSEPKRIFSPQAAWIVCNMLSDPASRSLEFGHTSAMTHPCGIAIKTGTSTGYRDCWAAAFTRDYTVVAWVGNFNERPTEQLTGAGGAAPIVSDILSALYLCSYPLAFKRPEGVVPHRVCSFSGMIPCSKCPELRDEWFIEGHEPDHVCTYHQDSGATHKLPDEYVGWLHERFKKDEQGRFALQGFGANLEEIFQKGTGGKEKGRRSPRPENGLVTIAPESEDPLAGLIRFVASQEPGSMEKPCKIAIVSPLDGDRFVIDPSQKRKTIEFSAVADKPMKEVVWFVNGVQYAVSPPPYTVQWRLERGRYTITAVAPDKTAGSVNISVN
ncbi:MAG: penicillin-binding protein 1C [Syntrophobacteraceae bacterium]